DGNELINIICRRLNDIKVMPTDSAIVRILREMSHSELMQAMHLGDVTEWHNRRLYQQNKDLPL
ncbi:hypothetical protein D6827_01905, partial [Candidatus Parcubacteria bacterium]